jgi:uncharacterized protein YsxB (DUF464 family)
MIKITYKKDEINISGHAQPDVCAAVSSTMFTCLKMLYKYDSTSFSYTDDTDFNIVINKHDDIIDIMLKCMKESFQDIYEMAPTNSISIKNAE